jgi:integrase/recombinase XerD
MTESNYQPLFQEEVELKIVDEPVITCLKCGSNSCAKAGFKRSGNQRYRCKECKAQFVPCFLRKKPLLAGVDTWTAEDLGLQVSPYQNDGNKLNFSSIRQEWLKCHIKAFIKYTSSQTTSFTRLRNNLYEFGQFSSFLHDYAQTRRMEDITRTTILEYLGYLSLRKLSATTKAHCLATLNNLVEVGQINKWFDVEPYLIRKSDYPKQTKALPRYMPDDVIRQLNQHLDSLPESIMRMVLVVQECGLRIGELCQLQLNCLKQDGRGGWFIQFMRWKMKFETTLPISIELAQVIQEQQAYIQQNLSKDFAYLFCGRKTTAEFVPAPKVITDQSFINHIKRLADEFDICDNTGKRWIFQTHQFRHTVGTQMINNGVPQHIIQRYLGHETPQMTATYAHIHDATLRKEVDKYLGAKIVNINGEVVESITPILDNDSELQWMSRKVSSETLSNGYCGLPAQLTCNKGNACLTCSDFRTTIEYLNQHKQHLERTNQVLEVAQANGWERQIQINLDVKNSLEKIITTLEVNQDG